MLLVDHRPPDAICGMRYRFFLAQVACWGKRQHQKSRSERDLRWPERPDLSRQRGVYGISVAAELVGMGVQNLRAYEARGLLEPERTEGGTRRYSADDLDRLRRIGDLLDAGLNLAGISMVLDLETQEQPTASGQGAGTAAAQDRFDPSEQTRKTNLHDNLVVSGAVGNTTEQRLGFDARSAGPQ